MGAALDLIPSPLPPGEAAQSAGEGVRITPSIGPHPRPLLGGEGISSTLLDRADSRAEIARTFDSFRASAGGTLNCALRAFCEIYNAGALTPALSRGERARIEVSAETRARFPRLTAATLQRTWRIWRRDGAMALVPRHGRRRGETIISRTPGMGEFILAMITHQPHVRVARIREGLAVRFPRVPSIATVQRFVAAWKREHPALFMRLRDPDDYKRKFSVSLGDAAANITRVNQLWEIDGSPADAYCTDGLFHLNVVIDVCSRKICGLLTPTASAASTAALLRKALPVLGVPDKIKSDWGSEYINQRIERAMRRLGITWRKVARPYSGELKPFVERGIGTLMHTFFEQCPGFKGHSPVEMAEIKARHSFQERRGERRNLKKLYNIELSSAELQGLLDRWLESVYGARPHAGLLGRTPNEVFAGAEARGEVRRVTEERALDLLLAEDGVAQVGTKGIRVAGALFWDDALIGWRGRRVQYVRTQDAGTILVFSADDAPEFVCVAVDYNAEGIDRQVVALAAKAREKEWMRAELDKLRRAKKIHRPENLLREIIEHAEARAAAALEAPLPPGEGQGEGARNVTALPYRSDGLEAAKAALAALEAEPAAPPLAHQDRAEIEAAERELDDAEGDGRADIEYDEMAAAERAVRRYRELSTKASLTEDEIAWMRRAERNLAEIRALRAA